MELPLQGSQVWMGFSLNAVRGERPGVMCSVIMGLTTVTGKEEREPENHWDKILLGESLNQKV